MIAMPGFVSQTHDAARQASQGRPAGGANGYRGRGPFGPSTRSFSPVTAARGALASCRPCRPCRLRGTAPKSGTDRILLPGSAFGGAELGDLPDKVSFHTSIRLVRAAHGTPPSRAARPRSSKSGEGSSLSGLSGTSVSSIISGPSIACSVSWSTASKSAGPSTPLASNTPFRVANSWRSAAFSLRNSVSRPATHAQRTASASGAFSDLSAVQEGRGGSPCHLA